MTDSYGLLNIVTFLGVGLVFGLKHATEVDHIVAVSTIAAQQRNVLRSSLVGVLWGAGHTATLLVVGVVVLSLRIAIPESVSAWLEFCVALMIIALGAAALLRAFRKRSDVHVHKHSHDGLSHVHIHFHESALIGLPFALTWRNLSSVHDRLQVAAAVVSIAFGLWYAYE